MIISNFFRSIADNLYQLKNIEIGKQDYSDQLAGVLLTMIMVRTYEAQGNAGELYFMNKIGLYIDSKYVHVPKNEKSNKAQFYENIADAVNESKFAKLPGVGYSIVKDIVCVVCEAKINEPAGSASSKYKELKDIFIDSASYREGIRMLMDVADPVISKDFAYLLGPRSKGAFAAWLHFQERRGKVKTKNDEIIASLLTKEFKDFSISGKTLEVRKLGGNTAYKRYIQRFSKDYLP